MTKLDKAKKVIKEHIEDAMFGIFDCRNVVGDYMTNIYTDEDITIDICRSWSYFEVFGLTGAEFTELEEYYEKLREESKEKAER